MRITDLLDKRSISLDAAPKTKSEALDIVMSKKSITLSEMVSHRKRNQGYGDFSDVAGSGSTISKLLFGEYVLEHFKMASDSV